MNSKETQAANTTICEKHGCAFIEVENELYEIFSKWGKTDYPKTHLKCPECDKEQDEKERIKEDNRIREETERNKRDEWDRIYRGIPKIYQHAEFVQIRDHKVISDFVDSGSGFLFIHGGCGTGKTHLMCSIKKGFNENNKYCGLYFASKIFLEIKRTFSVKEDCEERIIDQYAPPVSDHYYHTDNFSIFDDIGAQKISDYVIEVWYNIINERYMNGYKTIFTSNLSLKEIQQSMSDRIASRLASGIIYEMNGKDKRLDPNIKNSKIEIPKPNRPSNLPLNTSGRRIIQ